VTVGALVYQNIDAYIVFFKIWSCYIFKQEAFEKCWAHSPQRAASRHSADVASGTVARRLRIDVYDNANNDDNDDDDNDNA